MGLQVVQTAHGWESVHSPKAQRRHPQGITPIESRTIPMTYVTCRLRAGQVRGLGYRQNRTAAENGGPADIFDIVEDRHQPDDWFPPCGYMVPD